MNRVSARVILSIVVLLCGLAATTSASAATTIWTDWTSATSGNPGSAAGTLNGVGVTYAGQVIGNAVINGTATNWAPNSSFVGGTVTASPSTVGDIITLNGIALPSGPITNTVTFDTPIVNPLFAIWSLGAGSAPASFTFDATPTFEVGGPNANFGGAPVSVLGNVVSGREGNGVVQFTGTFSKISWTDTFENYYGFTVGTAGIVPEPTQYAMLLAGLGLLSIAIRRRIGSR
jgi:hypothetical protein